MEEWAQRLLALGRGGGRGGGGLQGTKIRCQFYFFESSKGMEFHCGTPECCYQHSVITASGLMAPPPPTSPHYREPITRPPRPTWDHGIWIWNLDETAMAAQTDYYIFAAASKNPFPPKWGALGL